MNTKQLNELLAANPESPLHIALPTGKCVPGHFHITEVSRVQKTFIDCGGTRRESVACVLQVWTADDIDHQLKAGKLSKIMQMAGEVLGSEDLPVEVEYGADVAAQYSLDGVLNTPYGLLFKLVGKKTDCLAPDKCGVTACRGKGCC